MASGVNSHAQRIAADYQEYRRACANAAKPHLEAAGRGRVHLEFYANAEFWAGWNAGIAHAAQIANGRHACWQESTLGSSMPCDDISACEDIAAAIRGQLHHKPGASRPMPESAS